MKGGRPRRDLLIRLCPAVPDGVIVDVGADHGHVAHALGAIATERQPNRIGRRDLRWVVADGLRPFRHVDVAVIAGMGARTIARILDQGPRPRVAAVLHAQDDPPELRCWLAANGWRIDEEGLAPEAGRYAEVLRAVPGTEEARGDELRFGPRLLRGDDPHLAAHLAELEAWLTGLGAATVHSAPDKHERYRSSAAFVHAWRVSRGFSL